MKQITPADIMDMNQFGQIRAQKRQEMIALKKQRRLPIGPDAMCYFESYQTLWWQIHEMLWIEKGGAEQIQDELSAYNPLIPQGNELVMTFMIEIENPLQRKLTLEQLGGIENTLVLEFAGHVVKAIPTEDEARTNEAGKTSSVHFLRFTLTPQQIADFCHMAHPAEIKCTHPRYSYSSLITPDVRQELCKDLQS